VDSNKLKTSQKNIKTDQCFYRTAGLTLRIDGQAQINIYRLEKKGMWLVSEGKSKQYYLGIILLKLY